jgi:hypothetical protein
VTFMWPDPVVRVAQPVVWPEGSRKPVAMPDMLVVDCSRCGLLTDWRSTEEREQLQRIAARHGDEEHDGLVEAVGWAR